MPELRRARHRGERVRCAPCKKLDPVCGIPTIDIEREVIIGYGPARMRAATDNAARPRLAK